LAYSVDEAAHVLGISRTSIYDLITERRLDSRKLCGRRIITRAALEALLADSGDAAP
jgi:excisionase family DNA binding protein